MGAILTTQILGGDPRKVVATRGPVPLKMGNHHALEGKARPTRDFFIPIHHFKRTAGLEARLRARAESQKQGGFHIWHECDRFVEYYRLSAREPVVVIQCPI